MTRLFPMSALPSSDSVLAPNSATPTWRHPTFAPGGEFFKTLNARVTAHFAARGISKRDDPRLYLKGLIILAWIAGSWGVLMFGALSLPLALLAGTSLALACTGAGFSIMHDGGHRAYSRHGWVNRWTFRVVDLLGASSYVWNYKHNVLHHTYANIDGFDDDIDTSVFARLSPAQPRRALHRFQHLYMWPLYGLIMPKWFLYDDWMTFATGRVGYTTIPRPKGMELAVFLGGKLVFFTLALGVPLVFHGPFVVLAMFAFVTFVQGVVLSVVFQLAHCVTEAEFPTPAPEDGAMDADWAAHQLRTTADFAPHNKILTWYVGGLNFQAVHHLFPRISHTHYPALAEIVRDTAREFGVPYHCVPTLRGALRSHYRHLRQLGSPA